MPSISTSAWASSSMGVLLSAWAWSCCSLRRSKEHKLKKTVRAIPSYIEHLLFDTPQVVLEGEMALGSLFIGACPVCQCVSPAFFTSTEEDLKWVSSTPGLQPIWPSQRC